MTIISRSVPQEGIYFGNEKRALFSILEGLHREGQERGEIRHDIPVEDIVRRTIHCYRGIICDWCLANGSFDLVEAGEKMTDILTEGLFTHRSPEIPRHARGRADG
jgi:hypothetical protein